MKLLFIHTFPPYPPRFGGQIRSFSFLKAFIDMSFVEVKAAIACKYAYDICDIHELQKDYSVDCIPLIRGQELKYCRKQLLKVINEYEPDIIHLDELYASEMLDDDTLRGFPFTLNAHNVEWVRLSREEANLQTTPIDQKSKIIFELEKEICNKAVRIFCCSGIDRNYLNHLCPFEKISIIPNTIDLSKYNFKKPNTRVKNNALNLLFPGHLSYPPNVKAAQFLIEEIWPNIEMLYPQSILTIAGRSPSPSLFQYQTSSIHIISSPESMDEYYNNADFVLVPLETGSGTRIKIIESMAYGIPIVSTKIGAEGLDIENGKHLFLSDTIQDFLQTLLLAIQSPDIEKIVVQARELVEKKYSYYAVSKQLECEYKDIMNKLNL